jgi:tellurite resistance protein TehA-like permease
MDIRQLVLFIITLICIIIQTVLIVKQYRYIKHLKELNRHLEITISART